MSLDRNNPNLLMATAKPHYVAAALTRAAHSGFLYEFLKAQGFDYPADHWDVVEFNRRQYIWNKQAARYEVRGAQAA